MAIVRNIMVCIYLEVYFVVLLLVVDMAR